MHPARNRLMALIARNRASERKYEIRAEGDAATVYLYDVIDPFWGVSAAQFVRDLAAVKAPTINLRINSPGGDVFDARAIATAIAGHPSRVVAWVDGLAASAASYIALAADEVVMATGSFLMIHRAWTVAAGTAEDLLQTAGVLEKIDATLAEEYAQITGASLDQVNSWLTTETWFTADEAVQNGFADRVAETGAKASAWDLSVYEHAPKVDDEPHARDEAARRFALVENIA